MEAISRPTAKITCPPLSACYVLDASLGCATVGGNKNITQSPSLSAQLTDLPFPTRARTWDLRINSQSLSYVILLDHQLLTASAHLRHGSRMQCNARVCNTTLLRFCIQVTITNACVLPVLREVSSRRRASFPIHTAYASRN